MPWDDPTDKITTEGYPNDSKYVRFNEPYSQIRLRAPFIIGSNASLPEDFPFDHSVYQERPNRMTSARLPAKNGYPEQSYAQAINQNAGLIGRLQFLKQKHPQLKIILELWDYISYDTEDGYSRAASDVMRAQFAEKVVSAVKRYHFDGVTFSDFAISWCGTNVIQHNPKKMIALFQEMRQALDNLSKETGQHYTLNLSVQPGRDAKCYTNMNLPKINPFLDTLYLDMDRVDSPKAHVLSNHEMPLYDSAEAPNALKGLVSSVQAAVDAYAYVIPAEKIILNPGNIFGTATFVDPSSPTQNGLYQPLLNHVDQQTQDMLAPHCILFGSFMNGIPVCQLRPFAINQMLLDKKFGLKKAFDAAAGATYAYSKKLGILVSYDDMMMLKEPYEDFLFNMHLKGITE